MAVSVLVVAGEASGDAHAARVVKALREHNPELQCFGIGSRALTEQGVDLVADARELAVVGLAEVLPKIPRILGILRRLVRTARERKPALALLVDSPDFNLRVARRLRRQGIPVLYYIAPQAWAWRRGRVRLMRKVVAKLAVVFPFEEDFFSDAGVSTAFVGHPLLDGPAWPTREEARARLGLGNERVVAILPGSRTSELKRHLAVMVEGARAYAGSGATLLLPVATTVANAQIQKALRPGEPEVRLLDQQSREALCAADCAVVASGTATVEAALAGTPAVVGYRLNPVTYWLAKMLIRTPFIAMPNLLAGRELMPELIQGRLTADNISQALARVEENAAQIRAALADVRRRLGSRGAADRVAALAGEIIALRQAAD